MVLWVTNSFGMGLKQGVEQGHWRASTKKIRTEKTHSLLRVLFKANATKKNQRKKTVVSCLPNQKLVRAANRADKSQKHGRKEMSDEKSNRRRAKETKKKSTRVAVSSQYL